MVSQIIGKLEGTPAKLLRFIHDNPGCHLRRVQREIDISMGNLQYQLDKLEKMGRVTSTKRGLYRYYFPAGVFKEREKEILEALTHENARKILMFIIEQKNPTQMDIVQNVRVSARSVGWHVGHLINLGIIKEARDKKYKRYLLLKDDPQYIIGLLRNYYPNVWEKWSIRVIELFLSLSDSKGEME